MKFVRPAGEDKIQELEAELENQKRRFTDATQVSIEKLQQYTTLTQYIREHPLQSAGAIFLVGMVTIQLLQNNRSRMETL